MAEDRAVVERIIKAEPAAIWAVIADTSRHVELDGSGQVRAHRSAPQELHLGSTFTMAMRFGLPYTVVNTVTELVPLRRIAWQTRPRGVMGRFLGGRTWSYDLEPVAGGTLVLETWDISTETIPAMVRPGRSMTIRSMTTTLQRLAEVVQP